MDQLSIFEMLEQSAILSEPLSEPASQTIRVEAQKNREVSYDVGEHIGGSRKDIAALTKLFVNKPSVAIAKVLSATNQLEASRIIAKENFFSWFSIDACYKRGVDIHVAYALSLLLRRIPKNAEGLNHEQYTEGLLWLSEQFQTVKTFAEFNVLFHRIKTLVYNPSRADSIEKTIKRNQKRLTIYADHDNPEYLERIKLGIERDTGMLFLMPLIEQLNLRQLGDFAKLFVSVKRIETFNRSINKYASWDEYFKANVKKTTSTGKRTIKPVWERELPAQPTRKGGPEVADFKTPEEFREFFGFRGVEFGLWVEDSHALGHMQSATKAFIDLCEILQLEPQHVSLGNQLGFAFGARGKGRALAHFERSYNVINLTKEKGALGVLAHEWWHALDRFLYLTFASADEGGMLTEGKILMDLPYEVCTAYTELMDAIKDGNATGYIDVSQSKNRYSVNSSFIRLYEEVGRNLQAFMDKKLWQFDKRYADMTSYYGHGMNYKKVQEQFLRKRKKELKQSAEAVAQLHKELTGEDVTHVPYTSNHSQFYLTALELDQSKKAYWSSNVELTARVFETYVQQQLQERKWRSDYLVCGIADIYPKGDEAATMTYAMKSFLKTVFPYLFNLNQ